MDGYDNLAADAPVRTLPLVVDLDDTLLRTDTLYESLAAGLFRKPVATLRAVSQLQNGRAAMKRAITGVATPVTEVLPANDALLDYLEAQAAAGRSLHLVSAADQAVVDQVAERFGFFESAMGSDGSRNLKGANKATYLAETFPDGFVYAGDSAVDLAVWEKAAGAILVGASADTAQRAERLTTVEARFDGVRPTARDWRKALRVHQWPKNVLIFAALFLGHAYGDPVAWLRVVTGFLLFSLAASGTYILNDLADLASDRRHATKCRRPIAAGRVPIRLALPLAGASIGVALAGMLALGVESLVFLLIYLALTLGYSFRLKRVPMLDVTVLASLYTIRIGLGAYLVEVTLSPWLLVFSMFFFLSLSMAKRYVEVARKAASGAGVIAGRGYHAEDGLLLLNFGVSTAACSVFVVCIYLLESAFPSGAYGRPGFLWIAVLMIALWTMRIWLLAYRRELDDDPVAFAIRDRMSFVLGAFAALGVLLAIVG